VAKLHPLETSVSSSSFTPHVTIIEDEDVVLVSGVSRGNNPAIVAHASLLASLSPSPSDLHGISGQLDS
jgi:hypothetical protein